jgi:hypothetical protein
MKSYRKCNIGEAKEPEVVVRLGRDGMLTNAYKNVNSKRSHEFVGE